MSFGNSMSLPENSQSASDAIELLNASVPPTPPGASGDAAGFVDDEPMCMHSVTPVSLQTWNTGSQSPLWIVGSFRWCGQLAEAERAHAAVRVALDLLRPRARRPTAA